MRQQRHFGDRMVRQRPQPSQELQKERCMDSSRQLCGIVLGGVALVKARIHHTGPLMVQIVTELDPFLAKSEFLAQAPFSLLNGIIRFGTKFDPCALIGPIDEKHEELPFAVEVEISLIQRTPGEDMNVAEVKARFLQALVPALFAIAEKYSLPVGGLQQYCREYSIDVPGEGI